MARPKVPKAPKAHPARQVLAEHTAKEVADALGLKPATIYAAKQDLKLPLADRIAEAFSGPVPAARAGKGQAPRETPSAARAGTRAPARATVCRQRGVAADEFLRQVEAGQVMKDMDAMARTAVAHVSKTEFIPAVKELISRLGQPNTPPAFLVIPLTGADLAKLKGKS